MNGTGGTIQRRTIQNIHIMHTQLMIVKYIDIIIKWLEYFVKNT